MSRELTYGEMLEVVPHRAPMLLLDRIEELVRGAHGRASKQVTEEALAGTLILDALGQIATAVLSREDAEEPAVWVLASIEDVQLGAAARAGETLRLEASVERVWKTAARITVRASIPNGRDVVKGTMVLSSSQ